MEISRLLGWRRPVAAVLVCVLVAQIALGSTDLLVVVLLTALVVWCAAAGDRAAFPIGVAALAVVLVGLTIEVLGFARAVARVGRPVLAAVWVVDLVLPALCVVVLAAALPVALRARAVRAGGGPASGAAGAGQLGAGQPAPDVTGSVEPAAVEPAPRTSEGDPVWQPDEASGAVWRTANEAASGASASEWGQSGRAAGWHRPDPEDDTPPAGASSHLSQE